MIDHQLRQQVRTEVESIPSDQGDFVTVVRRGQRRRRIRLAGQTFGVAAAIGLIGVLGFIGIVNRQTEGPSTGETTDLTLVMQPGEGPGTFAEQLARVAGPPLVEGSAVHLGWVETDDGRFDIVFLSSIGVAPGYPDLEVACRGVVNEASGYSLANCDSGPNQTQQPPGYLMDGERYSVFAETPALATNALVTTSNGQTIEIRGADSMNYVFAVWSLRWGPPDSLEFFNGNQDLIERVDYEDPETPAPDLPVGDGSVVATTVAVPSELIQDGVDLQTEILADGLVTVQELEQAVAAMATCMQSHGLTGVRWSVHPDGNGYSKGHEVTYSDTEDAVIATLCQYSYVEQLFP